MENNAAEDERQKEEEKQNMDKKGKHGDDDLPKDPRLKLLKKKWFEGKCCLHIGCNNGALTIQIAQELGCKSILGIDNNPDLVEEANLNLSKTVESISAEKKRRLEASSSTGADSDEDNMKRCLSDIVSFRKENFYETHHFSVFSTQKDMYDTIICLSTTHWTELNLKAHHLVTLFAKIWQLLPPKGRFVLESKSLKPYGRKFYNFDEAESWYLEFGYPKETYIQRDSHVRILPKLFLSNLLHESPAFYKVQQINSNGECILDFKKGPEHWSKMKGPKKLKMKIMK